MCTLLKTESIIALMGVVIGALIAIVTIYYGNRNNRKQIRTGKLEEIFQTVQVLSRHYGILMELWHKVQQLRNSDNQELRTLNEYYKVRDQRLTPETRTNMMELLSRLEVLTECYTDDELKIELLNYENLMYSFLDLITNAGSIHQEINWKDGYPNYEDFYATVKTLKEKVTDEIKL